MCRAENQNRWQFIQHVTKDDQKNNVQFKVDMFTEVVKDPMDKFTSFEKESIPTTHCPLASLLESPWHVQHARVF